MGGILVVDATSSDLGGGAKGRRRRSSASVREGTIAENCRRTPDQVICEALHLALVATQLRVAWHARAITAGGAMQLLDQACREIRARQKEQPNCEVADSCSERSHNWVSSRIGETS
jgi:hypothetical protein